MTRGALAAAQRRTLLTVARQSIAYGAIHGTPLPVHPADYHRDLKALRASFVTLKAAGELRGCIGHLEARQPLVVDVAENAYAAAFRDPRFRPVAEPELAGLQIQISVLTQPEPMAFADERDLVAQLHPGEDGLILADGRQRGTFLPSVWDSLPTPEQFLSHLKMKAGLASNHWSDTLQVWRYRTESFAEGEC